MIKIQIRKKRLNVGDVLDAQKGDMEATLRVVSACVIDPETDDYMNREKALALLRGMDFEALETDVIDPFFEALEVVRKGAVNPPSGGR